MHNRILIEDALKYFYETAYQGKKPSIAGLAQTLAIRTEHATEIFSHLEQSKLARLQDEHPRLTPNGKKYALHVIRAHRLFETYLWKETGYDANALHRKAEIKEHALSEEDLEKISHRLGNPRFDPHGDPIPTPIGEMPPVRGQELSNCPNHWEGKIVHLEDEPSKLYNHIVTLGLNIEMSLRILERNEQNIYILVEGRAMQLSMEEAALIFVSPFEENEKMDSRVERLSTLKENETAKVIGLSPACHGHERNRLLDLGLVPGSDISIELINPGESPIAYRIRGALIALRKKQANRILIKKNV